MATEDQRVAQQAINPPQFVPPLLNEDEKAYAKGFFKSLFGQAAGSAAASSGTLKAASQAYNAPSFLTRLWGAPLISKTQSPRGENVDIRTSGMEDLPMGEPTRLALQEAGWRRQGQQTLAQERAARIAAYDKEQADKQAAINARYQQTIAAPTANAAAAQRAASGGGAGGTLPNWQNFGMRQNMLSNRQTTGFLSHPMGFGYQDLTKSFAQKQADKRNAFEFLMYQPVGAYAPTYNLPGGGTVSSWSPKVKEAVTGMRAEAAQQKQEAAALRQNWAQAGAQYLQRRQAAEAKDIQDTRERRAMQLEREAESMRARSFGGSPSPKTDRMANQKMLEAQRIRSGAFGDEAFSASVGGGPATPYRFDVASGKFVKTSQSNLNQATGQRQQSAAGRARRQEQEVNRYLASMGASPMPTYSAPTQLDPIWTGQFASQFSQQPSPMAQFFPQQSQQSLFAMR